MQGLRQSQEKLLRLACQVVRSPPARRRGLVVEPRQFQLPCRANIMIACNAQGLYLSQSRDALFGEWTVPYNVAGTPDIVEATGASPCIPQDGV